MRTSPTLPPNRVRTTASRWEGLLSVGAGLLRSKYGVLLIGLAFILVIGLLNLQDYGTSVDEWHNAFYGGLFLRTYETGSLLKSPNIDYFNGPFYFMFFTVTSRLFQFVNAAWLATDARHLTNFLTFLAGVLFFYRLSLRLLPRTVSLILCALFVSQPVLFGHAFINQKDIPFMAIFLASVELGLAAMDRADLLRARAPGALRNQAVESPSPGLFQQWQALSRNMRVAWSVGALLLLFLAIDLWFLGQGRQLAMNTLADSYAGRGPALIEALFARVATDAYKTPVDAYLARLDQFLFWARLAISPLLLLSALALWRVAFPVSYGRSMAAWIRRWGLLLAAGCLLGLSTSIRLVGPLAGMLVALYAWGHSGRRALPTLILYAAVAMITTYLTWPALWGDPLGAFLDRALMADGFAQSEVFFLGSRYESSNLPWHYLPTLLAIQLTIPVVILFLAGIPLSMRVARRGNEQRLLVGIVWLWLLLPVLMVAAGLVPVYDNFRHELFVLPALFLVAGMGLEGIGTLIHPAPLRKALVILALLPGVVGIVRLHPYEYVYYNEIVGGVRGAAGSFELDYWCTAFREVLTFLDNSVEGQARVAFAGGLLSAAPFASDDFTMYRAGDGSPQPDLAVSGCRMNVSQRPFFPAMETVYEVRADGALLAVVKQRRAEP